MESILGGKDVHQWTCVVHPIPNLVFTPCAIYFDNVKFKFCVKKNCPQHTPTVWGCNRLTDSKAVRMTAAVFGTHCELPMEKWGCLIWCVGSIVRHPYALATGCKIGKPIACHFSGLVNHLALGGFHIFWEVAVKHGKDPSVLEAYSAIRTTNS